MYMHKHIYSYNMFCFQYLDLFLFHHCSYLLSSFCVPYVVSNSRFSMFALHFGILLRLFCKCGSCILILLHTCMLWWFHVRMNTNYARYRPEHISDDVLYMTNKTVDIQFTLLFLYLYKYVITFMFSLKNNLRKSHINNAFSDWYIMCSSQTAINPINFILFIYSNKIEYVVVN